MINFTRLISRRSALAAGTSGLSIGLIGLSGLRPLPAQNTAQGFTFALIGDFGYVPSEEPWLENVLTELSKDTALSFVVHVGDLSSPRYGCTDEVQARRLAQFNALGGGLGFQPSGKQRRGPVRWLVGVCTLISLSQRRRFRPSSRPCRSGSVRSASARRSQRRSRKKR
jgi:hypothetical protein